MQNGEKLTNSSMHIHSYTIARALYLDKLKHYSIHGGMTDAAIIYIVTLSFIKHI